MDDLGDREPAGLGALQAAKMTAALEQCGLGFGPDGRLRAYWKTPDAALRALVASILPDRFRVARGRLVSMDGAVGPRCDCLVLDRFVEQRIAPQPELDDDAGEELIAANAVIGVYAFEPRLSAETMGQALERLHEALASAGYDVEKTGRDALLPGGGAAATPEEGLSPHPAFGVIALDHDPALESGFALSQAIAAVMRARRNFDLLASLSGFLALPLDTDGQPKLCSYDLPASGLRHSILRASDGEGIRRLIWRTLGVAAFLAGAAAGRRMELESFQRLYFGD